MSKKRKSTPRAASRRGGSGRLNIKPNALFTADNLYVLNGMNSDCIDLIYLDPPFNSKRLYKAPVGSKAAGAAFEDMWSWKDVDSALMVRLSETHPFLVDFITAIERTHSKAMMAYIAYMAQRLFEMHRVLKPTGSIYLHCDPTASHYLKVVMDRIFGKDNFRNEIVWCYSGGGIPQNDFPRKHQVILRYSKSERYTFHVERKAYKENTQQVGKHSTLSGGQEIDLKRGTPVTDWWTDIKTVTGWNPEKTGYPTQKPLALLDRIIKASSNKGEVVLDPFCGCATTCVAAQHLHRKWIGIDLSKKTEELIRDRLADDVGALFNDFTHFTDLPDRRDVKRMTKKEAKPILYGTQEGNCAGCGEHFEARHLEVDHDIPKSKGGGDYLDNYQLMCGNCNRIKGNRPMEYLLMVIAKRKAQRAVFGATSNTDSN